MNDDLRVNKLFTHKVFITLLLNSYDYEISIGQKVKLHRWGNMHNTDSILSQRSKIISSVCV